MQHGKVTRSLLLGAVCFALALPLSASKKSEQDLVAQLSSNDEGKVTSALQGLEKEYPDSPVTKEQVVKFLKDPREKVHRKAARVAGALHMDLTPAQLGDITPLLDSPNKDTVVDGLKALRGLKAGSTIPKILPLLKSPDENIKRDACRTLSELGDKSLVPQIEPLLQDPNKKVREDARDAIGRLKVK